MAIAEENWDKGQEKDNIVIVPAKKTLPGTRPGYYYAHSWLIRG